MNRITLREIAAAWLCCAAIAAALVIVPTARQNGPEIIAASARQLGSGRPIETHRNASPDTFENDADRAAALAGLEGETSMSASLVSKREDVSRQICALSRV